MKRIMGNIKNRGSSPGNGTSFRNSIVPQGDSPEAVVVREVTAFCESGAPGSPSAGDEYLHLPAIVDSAESSPIAAKEAAACIRRYLSKENYQRGFAQYNAIMLTRILADNPAKPFTQNFDKHFIATTKELLREGKDQSVQQILRETLDYFEAEKMTTNDSLTPLVEMWRKEKGKTARMYGSNANGPRSLRAPPFNQYQSSSRHDRTPKGLPAPDELVARIEEAKTTARLLLQTIQSTPSSELLSNDLVKEFADRCSSAQRSIQAYMNSENPSPDEDTMLTLIETSDQLNIAMSRHQRALLQARKSVNPSTPSPQPMPQQQPSSGQNMFFNQQPSAPQMVPDRLPARAPLNSYGQSPPPAPPIVYGEQPSGAPQRMYNQQPTKPAQHSYSAYNPPASPPQRTDAFVPPPGPPPGARGAVRSQDYGYSNTPPPVPSRDRPMSQTQAEEYSGAENPFSDEAAQALPQKSYSHFEAPASDEASSPLPQRYHQQTPSNDMYSSHQQSRPPVPNGGTPSYMNKQEAAAENLTMHGASPPLDQPGRSPVSPVNADTNDVQRQMGRLHV